MPAPLAVDKEQVRMLVLNIGVRPAARELGIPEGTVQDWSAAGKWLEPTRPKAAQLPPPATLVHPTSPTNPADALANTLERCKGRTKVGLATWAAKSGEYLGQLEGEEAAAAHQAAAGTATVMSKLWPEQGPGSVRISMFAPQQVIDIEALPSCGTDVEQA